MSTAVTPVAVLEATPASIAPVTAAERSPPERREPSPAEPSLRLVIEEVSPNSGRFVYKTLDRETGEVVRQFPREEMLRLMADQAYASGDVIDTEA